MGFAEERYSELPFARQVADRFGTQHTEEIVTPDAVSLIDELTHYYDEPFADSSAIPTFLVARLASRSVKVVLSGDGGDEAFGGYARYAHDLKESAVRRWLPAWFRRAALGPVARVWPKADWLPRPLRAKTALSNLALDAGPAYANTLTLCRQPLRRRLMAPDLAAGCNGHAPRAADLGKLRDGPARRRPGRDDRRRRRPPCCPTISWSRSTGPAWPTAWRSDHRSSITSSLELAARIPSRWKIHRGQTKWILKQAVRGSLPESDPPAEETRIRDPHRRLAPRPACGRCSKRRSSIAALAIADLIDQERRESDLPLAPGGNGPAGEYALELAGPGPLGRTLPRVVNARHRCRHGKTPGNLASGKG